MDDPPPPATHRNAKRTVRADVVLLYLAVFGFSAGLSWLLVYKLGWRADLLGLLAKPAAAGMSFTIYAVLIGLGFGIAAAPLLVLQRVYKKGAGPAGDTGLGPL